MKVKRKRRILALMLGICLLLSTQIVAFAEDNSTDAGAQIGTTVATEETTETTETNTTEAKTTEPTTDTGTMDDATVSKASEDVPSVAAITGEKTVGVGKTITLTSNAGDWNHSWVSSNSSVAKVSGSGRNATVTGVKAGTATITHTYGYRGSETFTITVTDAGTATSGKIEAKVYLRYSNAVPKEINGEFDQGEFGPSKNNTPYVTVTVDLDQVKRDARLKESYTNSEGHTYYSIDNPSWGLTSDSDREAEAKEFWRIIRNAIDEDDRKALDDIFGSDKFIGYVLKKESDTWHIDGVLAEKPPMYMVELYEGQSVRFTISKSESVHTDDVTGVTYQDFEKHLKEFLGVEDFTYKIKQNDEIVVTYQKGGETYEATITPYTGDKDEHTRQYHVYPDGNGSGYNFGYREATEDVLYLCRLQIETTKIVKQDLTITKKVAGSAANTEEHFKFTVAMSAAKGNTYSVTYSGTEDCAEQHGGTVTFNTNGTADLILKHGESATIKGLPEGTASVTEANSSIGYKVSYTIDNSVINNSTASFDLTGTNTTVTFTNTLDAVPQTGLGTDNRPYIVGLLAVFLAGSAFVIISRRKRMRHE